MGLLSHVTLGIAAGELDHGVREEGGENRGPRIRQYLENCQPPINVAAPWCAAFVQYCSDVAARTLGLENPLDRVRLEAYVQNYVDIAQDQGWLVPVTEAAVGDLVAFSFGKARFDHIGFLVRRPTAMADGTVRVHSLDGNTSDASEREGDAVAVKSRVLGERWLKFLSWDRGV